jgi:hypothetical protein
VLNATEILAFAHDHGIKLTRGACFPELRMLCARKCVLYMLMGDEALYVSMYAGAAKINRFISGNIYNIKDSDLESLECGFEGYGPRQPNMVGSPYYTIGRELARLVA